MNAINWFEIPVVNFERALSFYQHIMATELKIDDSFDGIRMAMFAADCSQNQVSGCLIEYKESRPHADGVRIYLNAGKDVQPILERVLVAGGQVLMPKTELRADIGCIGLFQDSEGNVIGLHSLP